MPAKKKTETLAKTEFITSSTTATKDSAPTTTTTATAPAAATNQTPSATTTTTTTTTIPPITIKKPTMVQNVIYFSLVLLSVSSLLWLVYVSMQPVTFSPCALLNGTWFVSDEDAALSPLLVGKYSGPSYTDTILSLLGFANNNNDNNNKQSKSSSVFNGMSEYELIEQEKIAKNVVAIDLAECVDFASDTNRFPFSVLPLDIAPRHVKPLHIEELAKTFSGGAKTMWWTGECQSIKKAGTVIDSMCTLMLLRGHWALSVFPHSGEEVISALSNNKKKNTENQIPSSEAIAVASVEPYVVIGTRLDANEVAEEAVFNRKVKYVLGIMAFVGFIHYILGFFQPPTAKKLRKEIALAKLLAIEKAKLAQLQQQNAAKKDL